ncbi:MAG: hypothetical protein WCD18_20105 [Thermosynechococcaceae cyanobacterium]
MSTQDPSPAPNSQPVLDAEATSPPTVSKRNLFEPALQEMQRLRQRYPQGLFWLVVLATSTLTGAVAFQWLTALPPTPNCNKLLKATLSDSGQLYCADQSARKGDEASLSSALALAGSITEQNPLFEQSRQLADHWAQAILVLARQKVDEGDINKGVALAQKVPKTSGVYEEAQGMIQDWQDNWKKGGKIYDKARQAIADQNLNLAMEQVRDLIQIGSDYWQKRADKIVAEISIEQEAFSKIGAAQDLASSGYPDDLAKAIQAVSQIDPKRLARKRVTEKIDEWSQSLVDIAKDAQANGDYEGSVKAAQMVPPSSKAAKAATAYLQLGRAAMVAQDDSLWSSIQAYAYANQIESGTPIYEESTSQRQKWQGQIQNWGNLAIARWLAGFDQLAGYQLAIDQAAMVKSDEPRRVESQTLIAYWTKQIDSFTDRQFMARAKQMALDNTVASLQSAAAEASKVLSGQPLRDVAQTLIAMWSSTTERIEDQPMLDQAIAIAAKGDLNGAIQMADKINSDRALYGEAQSKIGGWVAQIQEVEDRPILNDAEALAREGRLSEAISRASDIGSNRAMYSEAQGRIADWAAQLRPVEEPSRPEPAPTESDTAGQSEAAYSDAPPEPAPVENSPSAAEENPPPEPSVEGSSEPPQTDPGTPGGAETGAGSPPP